MAVGGAAALWLGGHMLARSVSSSVQAHIAWDSLLLERLDNGDVAGGLKLLNANLDSELYTLQAFRESGDPLLPGMDKAFRRISKSRAVAPHEYPDPDAKATIERLLASSRSEVE